jgi:hypothetical protein
VAVVIACVALAIAIAVIFVEWAVMQRHREALRADVRNEAELARKQITMGMEQVNVSRLNYDEAVDDYRKMRERAQAHFLTADFDANRAAQRLDELHRYTKRTLEYHATTGAKPLILRGGLYVQQLAALDIVLELVDKFLVAVDADLMYRQDDGPDGSNFYLRWSTDKAPRDMLGSLTRDAHAGSDGSEPSPGTAELRAVLEALRDGGLGVLYLGPLILLRTNTCIQAGFLPPGFHCLTEPQKRTAVNGTAPNLMTELGVAVFLEFTQ